MSSTNLVQRAAARLSHRAGIEIRCNPKPRKAERHGSRRFCSRRGTLQMLSLLCWNVCVTPGTAQRPTDACVPSEWDIAPALFRVVRAWPRGRIDRSGRSIESHEGFGLIRVPRCTIACGLCFTFDLFQSSQPWQSACLRCPELQIQLIYRFKWAACPAEPSQRRTRPPRLTTT